MCFFFFGKNLKLHVQKLKTYKGVEEIISEVRKPSNEDSDTEEEDFWMPPIGEH